MARLPGGFATKVAARAVCKRDLIHHMAEKIDKHDRAEQFRQRLKEAMALRQQSQSALARQVGVDRSTISQLLGGDTPRLPNAQVVAECAGVLGVSADWLLSLSDRAETAADLLGEAEEAPEVAQARIDAQMDAWHREAAGYKIRHVPAALPDLLKGEALLSWDHAARPGRLAPQAIATAAARLDWLRQARSEYEIALPRHEMIALATATGYYADLPEDLRAEELERFARLLEELYPRLRLCLYDARRLSSSPMTLFGPHLAVLHLGQDHLAFRDSARVQAMTRHFDGLVREATVSARDMPGYLRELTDWI